MDPMDILRQTTRLIFSGTAIAQSETSDVSATADSGDTQAPISTTLWLDSPNDDAYPDPRQQLEDDEGDDISDGWGSDSNEDDDEYEEDHESPTLVSCTLDTTRLCMNSFPPTPHLMADDWVYATHKHPFPRSPTPEVHIKDTDEDVARANALEEVNEEHSLLLSVLPPEILSYILALAVETDELSQAMLKPRSFDFYAPFRMGAICRTLRRIAFSTPSLWSRGSFVFGKPERVPRILDVMRAWLDRSADVLVELYVESSPCGELEWTEWHKKDIMNLITSHGHHIKRLEMRLSPGTYLHLDMSSPSSTFPKLEALVLKKPVGEGHNLLLNFTQSMPALTSLQLSRVYIRTIVFNWSNLTSLLLRQHYIDEILWVLSKSPQLTSLSIRRVLMGNDGFIGQIPDRITLPVLEKLEFITVLLVSDLSALIDRLILPKMRELRFIKHPHPDALVEGALRRLVARSGCSLESAVVWGVSEDLILDLWSVGRKTKVMAHAVDKRWHGSHNDYDVAYFLPPL